ncbi:glutamate mutase L [Nocardioides sp.]|uniref:glutamate mutase L n=1 Tax=Nocardioides sp. TaxID=35761 RepID=UPI0035165915
MSGTPPSAERLVCVDVGSTFTKALLIDLGHPASGAGARVLAATEHPTTIGTDVLDGVDACVRALDAVGLPVVASSSAGGGLRIAVVGNEDLVTAEAGRRVALSSGGTVVAVLAVAGAEVPLAARTAADLARPDVVLLVGGTDGGNPAPLREAAAWLAGCGWRGPVVLAGNAEAAAEVAELLTAAGLPVTTAANVVPRIGVLQPEPARRAVREVFLRHVIGGKGLSSREDGAAFVRLVRGATPDVVLSGVEVLAAGSAGGAGVVVVDLGGATTDVHSVVTLDPEDGALARDVVAPTAATRTVEGDLGMRWSAPATVAAAEGPDDLVEPAARRAADPGFLPLTEAEHEEDERIAGLAVRLALRRHAGRARVVVGPGGRVVERTGTDLREVGLLVASGGVFRHGLPGVPARVLAASLTTDADDGWLLPRRAAVVVDEVHVLAAVGLLAETAPEAAAALAGGLLAGAAGVARDA